MSYLIGFAGPPRSGKDTLARHLAAIIEDRHGIQPQLIACSTPMREVVYCMLGIPYSVTHYDTHKDIPQPGLGGKSIRQAMIALSEDHVKPTYGHQFWGMAALARRWDPKPAVVIITDCGFDAEVELFTGEYGMANVVYPQISRVGCSFEGDSRSYVGTPGRTTSIINDGTPEVEAGRIYGRLVNQFGWVFPTR